MRRPLITVTVAVAIVLAGVSGSRQQLSSGEEQDPIRDQPACTIYCGDGSSDTVRFAEEPCWGGPLPAGQEGDRYNKLAPEDKERGCRTLLDPNSHNNRECPVFKTLAALCEKDKLPKDKLPEKDKPPEKKCEPPRDRNTIPPWFNKDAPCNNRQRATYSWGQNRRDPTKYSISISICGQVIPRYVSNVVVELTSTGVRYFNVCCDSWQQAIDSGSPCDPLRDIDCDGTPNENDGAPFRSASLAPRSDDFVSNPPLTPALPFWRKVQEGMPDQSGCKDCKWELVGVNYTCEHQVVRTGRRSERVDAKYKYEATWKCPATGQTEVTDESATMEGLRCPTPPNRSWP